MTTALLAALALPGLAGPAAAATNVAGAINVDTTWSLANSPYVMTSDVVVQAGTTLTIEAGVEIQGSSAEANDIELIIKGSLMAVGTEAAPIVFRGQNSENPGTWEGLRFDDGSSGTLQRVVIRHADMAIEIVNPTVARYPFDGVTIEKFRSRAITVTAPAAGTTLTLKGIQIDGGAQPNVVGIYLAPVGLTLTDSVIKNVTTGIQTENADLSLTRVIVAKTTTGATMYVSANPGRTLTVNKCTFYGNTDALVLSRTDSSYGETLNVTRSIFGNNTSIARDSSNSSWRVFTFGSFRENIWWGARILSGSYQPTMPADQTSSLRYNALLEDPENGKYAPTDRSPARYWAPADPANTAGALPFAGAATGDGVHGFWYANRVFEANTANAVSGDVVITRGVTMTFQPGSELLFASTDSMAGGLDVNRVELRVEGTLEADGTNSHPVKLRSGKNPAAAGDWYGILILSNTEAFNVSQVDLSHAVRGVSLYANDHIVAGSRIHHCSDSGIWIEGGTPSVEAVELYENRIGIYAYQRANADFTQLTVRNNTTNGIQSDMASFTMSDSIIRDNGQRGIQLAVNTNPGISVSMTHCTIANNTGDGLWYQRTDSSYPLNVSLISCSVTHNRGAGVYDGYASSWQAAPLTCRGSNSWGNNGQNFRNVSYVEPNTCYSANPLYADVDQRNYAPTIFSPNRGLGHNGSYAGAVPYAGAVGPQIEGWFWENFTFTKAGSPWTVLGDIVVTKNVVVTFEAGAVLKIAPNKDGMGTGLSTSLTELRFLTGSRAVFPAEGETVLLTPDSAAPAPGMWHGVRFENVTNTKVDQAIIEYGLYGIQALGPSVPAIEDTILRRHNTTGISFEGVNVAPTVDVLGVQVIGIGTGTGISLYNSSGQIRSSYVTHHTTGVRADVTAPPVVNFYLINNTIVHHSVGFGFGRPDSSYSANFYVANNVIAANTTRALEDNGGSSWRYIPVYLRNNNLFAKTDRLGSWAEDTVTVTTDPKIEDDDWNLNPRWWDGKLWRESLAVNAGTANAWNKVPNRDIIGKARPLAGGIDIGAWEYDPDANQEPRADAVTASIMVPRGEPFTVDGAAAFDPDGQIASAFWTFNDGTVKAGIKVEHTLANAGEGQWGYITIIDNRGAEDHAKIDINVNIRPVADAGPAVFQDVGPNESVFFDGTLSSDPDGSLVSWVWDFGDGSPVSREKSPRHSYLSAGLFVVTLTVTDNEGLTHSDTTLATVYGNVDMAGPLVQHQEIADGQPVNQPVVVRAIIRDPSEVASAVLWYRPTGGVAAPVAMTKVVGTDDWTATIPANKVTPVGVQYWITAVDKVDPPNSTTAPLGAPDTAVYDFKVVGELNPPAIVHTPIADGQVAGVAVTVNATITDETGVARASLYFRPKGGAAFGAVDMTRGAGNAWSAQIPAFVVARPGVDYYLEATDTSPVPNTGKLPLDAPVSVFSFIVGNPDQTPPVITHTPIADGQVGGSAIAVTASATDNAGQVVGMALFYKQAGAVNFTKVDLARGAGTSWNGSIPAAAALVGTMQYYLTATDEAGNVATSPANAPAAFHSFRIDAPDNAGPTITHTAVLNGQIAGQDVPIEATVTDPSGVSSVRLHYQPHGLGVFSEVALTLTNGVYKGKIPGFAVIAPSVDYYLSARDTKNNLGLLPAGAPGNYFNFTVQAQDNTGPTITHQPIANGQPAGVALNVTATVTDATGVQTVTLFYRVTGAANWSNLALTAGANNAYSGVIPGPAITQPSMQYYLAAIDTSAAHNQTLLPATGSNQPYTFTVVAPVPGPAAGDLVITEVMQDPDFVLDSVGEWFEVLNVAGKELELAGVSFKDETGVGFTVGGTLRAQAGQYLVFGNNADPATNGGVTLNYNYGGALTLSNTSDTLIITNKDAVEVDRIVYDGGVLWPDPTGAAMQLNVTLDEKVANNNDGANWCPATTLIIAANPNSDYGTPGKANTECIAPDPCTPNPCTTPPPATCANATTRRTFPAQGTCVDDDGVAACTYAPIDTACGAAEVCQNGQCVSGIVPVDFCRLQAPLSVTQTTGIAVTYYGRVYENGITTRTVGVDADPNLLAEFGYGPDGSQPVGNLLWTWLAAAPNPAYNGQTAGEPNNDEYMISVPTPAVGTYDYAFRFSADRGLSWTVCDGQAAGSSDGYQIANAGNLVSNPVVNPCQPNPCTTPPANRCDGNVRIVAASPGTCAVVGGAASCTYTETRTACAASDLCLDGACVDNPCLPNNPCTTPPAATCVDDRTRKTYASPGACTSTTGAAECAYAATDVACGAGQVCRNGACVVLTPGPAAGELVITEIMKNPDLVGDSYGEWFEVKNITDHNLELAGLSFSDDRTDLFTVNVETLIMGPGDIFVFGRNDDPLLNGGVPVDFEYGGQMTLGNTSDEIVIKNLASVVVDRVAYDGGTLWPNPTGASLQLDGTLDPKVADNNLGSNWCSSREPIHANDSDLGSPGDDNNPCRLPVDFCRLQPPLQVNTNPGLITVFSGRVRVTGVTDLTTGVDAHPDLLAQFGYGPDATNPSNAQGWTWKAAAGNPAWNGTTAGEPTNDEYQYSLAAPAVGTYDYAYRFSADHGLSWTYCDGQAAGSTDGYQIANAGDLRVTAAVNPCQPNPCNTPPASTCDGTTAVSYAVPGACVNNGGVAQCTYTPARTDCAATGKLCDAGICVANPCNPNPCTTPPAADCLDGQTARTYASPGTCTVDGGAAECTYIATNTACAANQSCEAGVCRATTPTPGAGDLVITEIMQNPAAVGDATGEWFEVVNVSGHALELAGLRVNGNNDNFTVAGPSVPIAAGKYFIFGKSGDLATNGGVAVDYVYPAAFALGNDADLIALVSPTGVEIDRVAYTGADPWIDPNGASMQLDGELDLKLANNADARNWCEAKVAMPNGDRGTPGKANSPCGAPTVDWCRLQAPLTEETTPGTLVTFYGRVYEEGITDLSTEVDPDPDLVGQVGWGPTGSLPAGNQAWRWFAADPNPAWDGALVGEPNNDEYLIDVPAPAAGTYDFAYRFSADGGATWLYCDGGIEGSSDGYDPADSGMLIVAAVENPCEPNPCTDAPPADCVDGTTRRTYTSPGTCSVVNGAASCNYASVNTACGEGRICDGGVCTSDLPGPRPGELIITEILFDPTAADDSNGEWFEVYNGSDHTVELAGLTVADGNRDSFTIAAATLPLQAGQYLVLARKADPAINGGVTVGYEYGTTMTLANSADKIIITSARGEELDRVEYTGAAPWQKPSGASLQFDPRLMLRGADNNVGSNWCIAAAAWGVGRDKGTPGAANPACTNLQLPVDFCRLEAPLQATVRPGQVTRFSARLQQLGLTDRTAGVDADPFLRAELGFGPDGVAAAAANGWSWAAAQGDGQWNATAAGAPGEDRYLADLAGPQVVADTHFDVAFRFSVDGGLSWTYCDGDPLGSKNGYAAAQAADLFVQVPVDPCSPNPCVQAQPAVCENDTTARTFALPGRCAVVNDAAQCTYTPTDTVCQEWERCVDGACQSIIPTPAPGELVISEIMVDPVQISDDLGEWFEVYNATDHEVNLAGLVIGDGAQVRHPVNLPVLRLAAHGYAVFGKSGDRAINGNVAVDFVYPRSFNLANAGGTIVLTGADGQELDRVQYQVGQPWPANLSRASLQLDAREDFARVNNNDGAMWCRSTLPIRPADPNSDFGSPGAANSPCGPVQIPVDFCRLQAPLTLETVPGALTVVTGRVLLVGITDQDPLINEDPNLLGQLGVGPDGILPAGSAAWSWTDAAPNPAWDGDEDGEADLDEYQAELIGPAVGTYDYAFRFSADGGLSWTYCDGGAGSADGYQAEQAGQLTVVPPADPCDPNPCNAPPGPACDGNSVVTYAGPGQCRVADGAAACEYPSTRNACAADQVCRAGVCVPRPEDVNGPLLQVQPVATPVIEGTPIEVMATATDDESGMASVQLFYRTAGGAWRVEDLIPDEGDGYLGAVPADRVLPPSVELYVLALDLADNATAWPADGADAPFVVTVNARPADVVPPVIEHEPVATVARGEALAIEATITDDASGIARAQVYWRTEGEDWVAVDLVALPDAEHPGFYTGQLPTADLDESVVALEYYLTAADGADNEAFSPADAPDDLYTVEITGGTEGEGEGTEGEGEGTEGEGEGTEGEGEGTEGEGEGTEGEGEGTEGEGEGTEGEGEGTEGEGEGTEGEGEGTEGEGEGTEGEGEEEGAEGEGEATGGGRDDGGGCGGCAVPSSPLSGDLFLLLLGLIGLPLVLHRRRS